MLNAVAVFVLCTKTEPKKKNIQFQGENKQNQLEWLKQQQPPHSSPFGHVCIVKIGSRKRKRVFLFSVH